LPTFYSTLTLAAGALALAVYFLVRAVSPGAAWVCTAGVGVAWLGTVVSYAIASRGIAAEGTGAFLSAVLGTMSLKLVLYLGYLGLVLWLLSPPQAPTVGSFFAAYVLCTALEVAAHLRTLRRDSKNGMTGHASPPTPPTA
jgi:hypothetical protein